MQTITILVYVFGFETFAKVKIKDRLFLRFENMIFKYE
jgi:hypothetical protein